MFDCFPKKFSCKYLRIANEIAWSRVYCIRLPNPFCKEKIKLLELQNIYSLRIPKTVPSHLPPAENSQDLTPEMHDRKDSASAPAITRTMSQVKSRPTPPTVQTFCVKMGRSRIRPVDSGELSTRTEPDVAAAKSMRDTNHKSGTVFSLLVDSSTCESMVDPCTNSDVTGHEMNERRMSGVSNLWLQCMCVLIIKMKANFKSWSYGVIPGA